MLAGTLLVTIGSQIVTFAILHRLGVHAFSTGRPGPTAQLLLTTVSEVSVTLYLLAVLPLLAKRSLAALGIRTPKGREIGIGLLGGLAMVVIANPLAAFMQSLTHATHPEAALALLKALHEPWQIAAFVGLACVLAPIAEELVFRVFIFNAFARYGGFWPAAAISSVIFGLVHVSTSPLDVLVFALPLAFGGVVLTVVYARAKCYWSNVIAHALFNTVSVVAILVFHAAA